MPKCFVVPGLLGTNIWSGITGNLRAHIWMNMVVISSGGLGALRLDPTGTLPGPPDGDICTPVDLIDQYYGVCVRELGRQLGPHGYTIVPYPYDWRLRTAVAGRDLAQRIAATVRPTDPPCAIVAHSQGGLVARAAWEYLGRYGLTRLCRRIVTLGCPHYGSFTVPSGVQGLDVALLGISWATTFLWALAGRARRILGEPWTVGGLAQLLQTWPGLWEMSPWAPPSPGSNADGPFRQLLYDPARYQYGSPAVANGLATARAAQAYYALPATIPPAEVLTTVAGVGVPTMCQLAPALLSGQVIAPSYLSGGDGTVLESDALMDASARYSIPCGHVQLPDATASSGELAAWILAVRRSGDPVPPVQALVGAGPTGPYSIPPGGAVSAYTSPCRA